MTIQILPHPFTVCKVANFTEIGFQSPFTFTACSDEEVSVVCPTQAVPQHTLERENGWRALRIAGVLDFSLIGILARITTLLAEEQIGVFVVSTYNTDYILVKEENLLQAKEALLENDYMIEELL